MSRSFAVVMAVVACGLSVVCGMVSAAEGGASRQVVDELLSTPGVRAGICVHVACGDGRLTADLLRRGMRIVQGVDVDRETVQQARRYIESTGRYGPVSVVRGSLKRLPYSDNLVNLVVVDDLPDALAQGFTVQEAMRVLAPHGTALFGGMPEPGLRDALADVGDRRMIEVAGRKWAAVTKPYPENMDEWPQYFHDAGHTRISQDGLVGPTTGFQWIHGGFFSQLVVPVQSFASANGRNFYVKNLPRPGAGGPVNTNVSDMHVLEVRDAFNGLELWQRPIWAQARGEVWKSLRTSPILALGDRVFTHLEQDGPLVALDAATGQVIRTYDVRGDINCYDGLLIVRTDANRWVVLDPETGSTLRTFTVEASYHNSPMLIADGRAFVLEAGEGEVDDAYEEGKQPVRWWSQVKQEERPARGELLCFDFATGESVWRKPNVGNGRLYWCRRGILMTRAGNNMHAFSTEDGRHLWSNPMTTKKGGYSAAFYMGDYIWGHGEGRWYYAYDPLTGEVVKSDSGRNKEFGRCGPDAATERYILGQDLAIYDMQDVKTYNTKFTRGDCGISYMPANGMFYQYGQVCTCSTYVPGVQGISTAPLPTVKQMKERAGEPFEKGPAFGSKPKPMPTAANDWPTHRHDPSRSAACSAAVPARLAPLWKAGLGAPLTAPVVVGDTVYVASMDQHRVVALEAGTGRVRWDFIAGGRIDTPPTVHEGMALFGCRDGWVYCLRTSDGELIWKRRAAPEDRMISVRGQLESVWPVFGAVLLQDGVAYFCAGRHGDADRGVFFYAVEPATGKVLWQQNIRGFPPYRTDPHRILIEARKLLRGPFDEKQLDSAPQELLSGLGQGFRNDLLISDGKTILINAIGVDLEERQARVAPAGQGLYTPVATLLSDNSRPDYHRRNQWFYVGDPDRRSWRHTKGARTSGSLLVVGPEQVFGTQGGHHVFARPPKGSGGEWWRTEDDADGLRVKSLVAAGDKLFAGCRMKSGTGEEEAGEVRVYSAADGRRLAENPLGGLPRFDGMAATDGRLFVSTEAGELVCMGSFFRLAERDRTLAGGAKVVRTIEFSPDASPQYPFELRWELRVGGRTVQRGAETFRSRDDLSSAMKMVFNVPRVEERTSGGFVVALHRAGREVFRDATPLQIINADAGPRPQLAASELCVWDPSGAVGRRLKARGIGFRAVEGPAAVPQTARVLVVGKDALSQEQAGGEDWAELTGRGMRILFLDQKNPIEPHLAESDYRVDDRVVRRGILRDADHPCLKGLGQSDFDRWPDDGVLCRKVLSRGRNPLRSVVSGGEEREACLVELPANRGLIMVCQLDVGDELDDNPVAERLFDNMLAYCADFQPRFVALALPKDDPRAEQAYESGLIYDTVEDVVTAISDGKHNIVVADATPDNLKALAGARDSLHAFTEAGGWLMLWGLTPEGLEDFNRIVGVDHLLRPYEMERVRPAEEPDPLVAGLSAKDLDITSDERYGYWGEYWPEPTAYTHVVDYDDIAPFCQFPPPEHWHCPGRPQSDRWPRNMVNGFWDWWKACFVFNLDLGAPPHWTMELPRRERVVGFSVIPNGGYNSVRGIELRFGEPGAEPVTLDLPSDPLRQDIEFAPRPARKLTVEITDWDASVNASILGVDNLWVRVERPDDFFERVRPLAGIGVLVKYPMGSGGIVLNQTHVPTYEEINRRVKARGDEAAEAAGKDPDQARWNAEERLRKHLDRNAQKKARILERILWNMGARFTWRPPPATSLSLAERRWVFDSGDEMVRTVRFDSPDRYRFPMRIVWQLNVAGETVGEGSRTYETASDLPDNEQIKLALPTVADRAEGEFSLRWLRGAQQVWRSDQPLSVINTDAAPRPAIGKGQLHVLDPGGSVRDRLAERDIPFTQAADLGDVPATADVLIVGPDAISKDEALPAEWRELTENGTKVLTLEQKAPLDPGVLGVDSPRVAGGGQGGGPARPAHPVFRGLTGGDFEGLPYGVAHAGTTDDLRVLGQAGRDAVLWELQTGRPLVMACHWRVGEDLAGNPVAKRLFDNMLSYCCGYVPKSLAVALAPGSPRAELLASCGLEYEMTGNLARTLQDGPHNVILAEASADSLRTLAANRKQVRQLTDRGGWLVLWGLTPDGLGHFNELVGVEHLLRPYEMEKVELNADRDYLVSGLTDRNVAILSGEAISKTTFFAADDAYSYVVDLDDIAPFCTLPGPAYWKRPDAEPKVDRWPRNMVNGFTGEDHWRYGFVLSLDEGAPTRWTMQLPREEQIVGFSFAPGPYHPVTKIRLSFDIPGEEPVELPVRPVRERQEFSFAPRRAKTVTVELAEWEASSPQEVLGVDNLRLRVRRSPEFHEKVRPLLNIGALVKYPVGRGGILLNQLRILSDSEKKKHLDAAPADEREALARHLEQNARKKATILRTVLQNLGIANARTAP